MYYPFRMNIGHSLENTFHDFWSLLVGKLLITVLPYFYELSQLTAFHQLHSQKDPISDFPYLNSQKCLTYALALTCLNLMMFSWFILFNIYASCLSKSTSSVLRFFRLMTYTYKMEFYISFNICFFIFRTIMSANLAAWTLPLLQWSLQSAGQELCRLGRRHPGREASKSDSTRSTSAGSWRNLEAQSLPRPYLPQVTVLRDLRGSQSWRAQSRPDQGSPMYRWC
jgi:hypothetical protein